nr:hypothetical protein [Tanacetum cinerariifolium]
IQPSGEYYVVPPPITGNFMPPKPDLVFHTTPIVVETAHSAFTIQLRPAKPTKDLSHTTRLMAPIIENWVSDTEDESEPNDPQNVLSFAQPTEYVKPSGHFDQPIEAPILAATPKPTSPKTNCSSKIKNRKLILCAGHASFTKKYPQKHIFPAVVLTKSKPVHVTAVRPVSADVLKIIISRPRHAHLLNTKSNSTIKRHKTCNQFLKTSNSSLKVTAAKASVVNAVKGKKGKWGNPQYTLKDKGVIDSGCSRHMTGNMSYLFDFQELNAGYVAFGGNPKGGKISGKGKIKIGKFEGKVDEGFLVGYSINSKAFRVFNSRTCIVQETLHANFLENKPNVAGTGPTWLFDIDSLTRTMIYQPVTAGNQTNPSAGFQETFNADKAGKEANQQYMLFPVWSTGSSNPQNKEGDAAFDGKEHDAEKPKSAVNLSPSNSTLSGEQDDITKKKDKGKSPIEYFTGNRDLNADFEDYSEDSSNDVSAAGPIVPTARQNYSNNTNPISAVEKEDIVYSDHENVGADADFNNLETSITEELIQFKMQKVWILVNLPHGKRAIGTKWVYRNKKDERGIVVRNKARLVAQGHTQEEGIDYEEVFAFMGFIVYQMDIYVDDIIFGASNKDLWKSFEKLIKDKFQMSLMGELTFFLGLQVKQKKDGIFISQDKYVAEILKKFGLTEGKSASTPIDTEKPLLKDPNDEDVDVHIYRSMIGSLMYLTSSRLDIMFALCACACFQVTLKDSHLHAVKRIFRYLKGKPHLGLWYPKDSPFDLVAYSDNDYASASLDRKSTTEGCQFLRCRLISWQYKKQTVVATSSTEAEYVAGASCCAQVLWI